MNDDIDLLKRENERLRQQYRQQYEEYEERLAAKDKALMRVNQELNVMKERWRNMTFKYRRSRDLGYFLLVVVISAIWAMLIIGSG